MQRKSFKCGIPHGEIIQIQITTIILYTIQACPTGDRRIGFIIRCISVSAVYYMKYVRTLQQEDNIKHEKNRLYVLGLLSSIICCELYCSTPFILSVLFRNLFTNIIHQSLYFSNIDMFHHRIRAVVSRLPRIHLQFYFHFRMEHRLPYRPWHV